MKKLTQFCLGFAVIWWAIFLLGCAHVKPIVAYTCMGCQALISSGLCRQMMAAQPQVPPPVIPECKAGEVLVVDNWDAVVREGAGPILKCEKP